jgi:hypothetical protein
MNFEGPTAEALLKNTDPLLKKLYERTLRNQVDLKVLTRLTSIWMACVYLLQKVPIKR